jgi:hypothetical protein
MSQIDKTILENKNPVDANALQDPLLQAINMTCSSTLIF